MLYCNIKNPVTGKEMWLRFPIDDDVYLEKASRELTGNGSGQPDTKTVRQEPNHFMIKSCCPNSMQALKSLDCVLDLREFNLLTYIMRRMSKGTLNVFLELVGRPGQSMDGVIDTARCMAGGIVPIIPDVDGTVSLADHYLVQFCPNLPDVVRRHLQFQTLGEELMQQGELLPSGSFVFRNQSQTPIDNINLEDELRREREQQETILFPISGYPSDKEQAEDGDNQLIPEYIGYICEELTDLNATDLLPYLMLDDTPTGRSLKEKLLKIELDTRELDDHVVGALELQLACTLTQQERSKLYSAITHSFTDGSYAKLLHEANFSVWWETSPGHFDNELYTLNFSPGGQVRLMTPDEMQQHLKRM